MISFPPIVIIRSIITILTMCLILTIVTIAVEADAHGADMSDLEAALGALGLEPFLPKLHELGVHHLCQDRRAIVFNPLRGLFT